MSSFTGTPTNSNHNHNHYSNHHSNLNQHCLICCKDRTVSSNSNFGQNNQNVRCDIFRRFCVITAHYLNLDNGSGFVNSAEKLKLALKNNCGGANSGNSNGGERVCDNCVQLLSSFCDSYKQLQELQLKVDRELERITNVIRLGEAKEFHESIKEIKEFRRNLIKGFDKRQKRVPPPPTSTIPDNHQQDNKVDALTSNPHHQEVSNYPGAEQLISLAEMASSSPSLVISGPQVTIPSSSSSSSSFLQKKAICTFCGKDCYCLSKLKIHERTHTGERPFCCGFCQQRFIQRSDQLKHERIHTGPGNHSYSNGKGHGGSGGGGKGGKNKLKKRKNAKKHQKGRPPSKYTCKYCEKDCGCLSKLQIHERIHTGEKPYSCQMCEQKFIQRSDQIKHERQLHKQDHPKRKDAKKISHNNATNSNISTSATTSAITTAPPQMRTLPMTNGHPQVNFTASQGHTINVANLSSGAKQEASLFLTPAATVHNNHVAGGGGGGGGIPVAATAAANFGIPANYVFLREPALDEFFRPH